MSELARIDVEELGTRRLIRINGEVDISNSRELATAIERAVSDSVEGVVIDLSGTTYLDSAAIELLFRLAERLHGRRHRLHLVIPPGVPVRSVIELTGLSDLVPVWEALADVPAEPGDRSA